MRPTIMREQGETKIKDFSEMNSSVSEVTCTASMEDKQSERMNSHSSENFNKQEGDEISELESCRLNSLKHDQCVQTDSIEGPSGLFLMNILENSPRLNKDRVGCNSKHFEDIYCGMLPHDDRHLSLSRSSSIYSDKHPNVSQRYSLPTYAYQVSPPDSGVCSESTSTLAQVNTTSDCDSCSDSVEGDSKSDKLSAPWNFCNENNTAIIVPFKEILNAKSKHDSFTSLEKQFQALANVYPPFNPVICGEILKPNTDSKLDSRNKPCETDELLLQVSDILVTHQICHKEKEIPPSADDKKPTEKSEKEIKSNKYKKLIQANAIPKESFCSKYTSCRWVLAYMCFMGRFVQTALRQCMGVAVLGMTMARTYQVEEIANSTMDSMRSFNWSGLYNYTDRIINRTYTEQEMSWDSIFEGVLLASFNAGSILTPIIVGYLTTRHGGRTLMTVCLLCAGGFTVILPVCARAHTSLIIVLRLLTGIALSGSDSLIQAMWAKWAPRYELASLTSCSYSGLSVAGVLTFLISGYLVSIGGDGKGWPNIFYVFGSLCLILAPIWWVTVYDSPESHPRITKKELAIITYTKQPEIFDDKQPLKTPWKKIIKSPAVWVILMGHISNKWILSFMLSYLPRYFSDFFAFDLETDGLLSSLPFVGRIISGLITGYLSDWMLRRGLSVCKTRKTFQGIGCFGCAVFSLFIAFIPSLTTGWSISLLVLALSFQNVTSVAFRINLLDIAPRYAGLLNGVVSTIATLISLPAPVLTSLMIAGGSRDGWTAVFCLVAAFNFIGGFIFVVFAQGEVQDWAKPDYTNLHDVVVEIPEDKEHAIKEVEVSVIDSGVQVDPEELQPEPRNRDWFRGRALRGVRSVPVSMRRGSKTAKEKVGRRATMDVGSLLKRVKNQAFSNLALADL